MTQTTLTDTEIYAAHRRTAALKDLQFTLRRAEWRLAEFDLPAQTVSLIAEMFLLEERLTGIDGTPALQKQVGRLLERYRASMPGYVHKGFPWPYRRDGRRRWVGHRTCVPQRRAPLDAAALALVIASAAEEQTVETSIATKPAARKRVAAAPALACPQCRGLMLQSGETFVCEPCAVRYALTPVVQKPARVAHVSRPPAARVARIEGATEKTCTRCSATRPIAQYLWGAGKTERNVCLLCRKEMQKAATERRRAA